MATLRVTHMVLSSSTSAGGLVEECTNRSTWSGPVTAQSGSRKAVSNVCFCRGVLLTGWSCGRLRHRQRPAEF
jgi:hypothetical protein